MNNLGYSNDNLHIGDVRIKGQNETLIIGNENSGNGYILPTEKGNTGDVLTMNADNSTSFQPIPDPPTTIEKPIQNLLTMLTPRTSYTQGNADPYFLSVSGSEIVDTTDFEVGDVIRVRVEGYYVNNATNPTTTPCTITHQWFINMPNTSPSNETLSSPVQFFGSGGNWFNEVIITWESASSVRISFNGKINYNTGGALSDEVRALNWFVGGSAPPGTERPKSAGSPYYIYPPPTSLQIRGQNRTDLGDGYAIATNYYMDKMNVNALVSGGGVPTIDHLTLSNLNVASGSGDVDAGHSTLVCLDGRAGGQQIIGGRGSGTLILKSNDTTPLINNIELGSGLDTKIHKIFSNSVAAPLVIEHESAIDKIDLRINNNNKVEIKDTEIQLNEDLNLNNNSLLNALGLNTQFLLATSQIETSLIVGLGVGPLPITSNDLTLTENNLPGGEYMNFNNVRTLSYKPLDMNNGPINNVVAINNLTPVGGLFAGTADSLTLTASTAEQSILPTAFVGPGFSVPPNAFQIGDSFHCVLAGDFGSNNGDTLTIRLKAGPTSTTILATLVVPLNNSSGSSFETEIDFQLRNIGGAGVADICSNFDFTYNQSGGGGAFVGERGVFQNNTTFDTTVLNILEITAQFSSTNASNTIKTIVSKLSKDF